MKKQLAIILSGALLLGSLYGCGDSGSGFSGKTTAYEESELAEGTDLRTALHVPDSVKETWHSNSGVTVVTVNAPEGCKVTALSREFISVMVDEKITVFLDLTLQRSKCQI